ncbi:MAG: hypothetical protein KF795_15935 [Labilithrix sp.]|nr:hypothetical protein [Labilithrix sp.]
MRGSSLLAGLTCVGVLTATNALAAPRVGAAQVAPSVSEQMLAQSLFDEARQLMDRGKYADACPKLAESQRLDPGGGTLLNLAICHEKEGRFGSAHLEMKAAASQAVKEGRKDREKLANERLAALASRVPRLAVHVDREEPDLEVKVDGTLLRKPAWDLLTVVDPGEHVVEASAPNKAPFRQTITLAEGEQRTVHVPALQVGDGRSTASAAPGTSTPGGARPETRTNPLFVASIATGVTGFVVGIPAGYVWTMTTLLKSTCRPERESVFCPSDGARTAWFTAAVVGLSVGVLGTIGIAAFPRKIQVAPTASASAAGATVLGEF